MISKNTYEEVHEILQCMDKSTIDKIPQKILKEIQENRNIYYKTKIDKKDIFNEKNVSKETIDFLCYLDYNYWMSDEEKRKIDKINYKKFIIEEEEKRKKYNPENIFKQHKEKCELEENTSLVEVKTNPVLEKIKKIMKKLRKIFFRKGRLLKLRIILGTPSKNITHSVSKVLLQSYNNSK